jgi:4-amino-4-deoxy-L-arabinose transferase-like glycosyltransferase
MSFLQHHRTAISLLSFAAAYIALATSSYVRESGTWDEPQHVVAGYSALTSHDYRTDPEHPPFIRMWAALPLSAMDDIKFDTTQKIDTMTPAEWVLGGQFYFCHYILYIANDADHLLYAARFMIVLLGVLLGVLVFCWARELFGFWPALVALGFYTIEPNLLAHARLVTTDFGITCFGFGTMYFLWRAARHLSVGNFSGLVVFFTLAQISKFSAVLLGPIVLALLIVRVCHRSAWKTSIGRVAQLSAPLAKLAAALGLFLALAVVAWVAIWAVYDFRYLPSAVPQWRMEFHKDPLTLQRTPTITRAVAWVDEHRLLPNAYSEGFLIGQAKAQKRSGFLAGSYRINGWWWFFPFAFLIKTPISVLLLFVMGVVLCLIRWRRFLDDTVYLLLPLGVFLVAAMTANLNIGARHILPIYPFVLLLAGYAVDEFYSAPHKPFRLLLASLCLLAISEFIFIYPHYLAFFNQFAGGPRNGHKYLIDSNLDWGQDLKGLKRWMDEHNVQHINLSYFGTADPAYYKINCTYLPGGPFFDEKITENPRLPGLVAVSATNLRGLYFPDSIRNLYTPLLDTKPTAVIGYSIYVYWVDRPLWQ